ncbi:hypothetical protein GCM10007853_02100 [Algimonas ampicilliniresistens]|uniref:TonB-dependent receptor n=1 Tax=Algimonas ampicilliniresistens TaxID=1298735 RepID=A0ABQ5V479_9PROT|nr:TonB-dependent receptor [Algimonas ampicilliniresistens]GLQ22336.1 hypothetical protein GCM10007853_02100 [Algimonas ampicilliniresistens]
MSNVLKPLLAVTTSLCLITGLTSGAHAVIQPVEQAPEQTSEQTSEQAAETTLPAVAGTSTSKEVPAPDTYPASYFASYVPRTALDMVRRIPGFQVQSGDTGRRGLGQGGANVLINGERLTGKADARDELEKILADNVVEIRIRDGASLSIPGLSGQVADITVSQSGGLKGTWEWNPQFRRDLEPNLLNAEINLSGEFDVAGGLTYALQLREYGFRGGATSDETRSDASGIIFEHRTEKIQNFGDRPGVALNLGWTPAPDHKINLNTEYYLFNFNRSATGIRTPVTADGDDSLTLATESEDEWNLEIDGDYEFPFLDGQLKITGVLDREHSPTSRGFAVFDPQTGFVEASRFDQTAEELELVGRVEYSWSLPEGGDWQFAGEGAYNELDIEQQLLTQEPDMAFVGRPMTGFNVSEDRFEGTVTHSRPYGDKWDLQASAGVEYSKLMQERLGLASVDPREFVRPKGFLSATYKVDDSFQIRSKVEREVGQLNFFDFISSVDLQEDLDRSANPDLIPSQSWLASLEFDKDFGQGNTFRIEFYGAAISDTVDRIPIGVDGDGVGNIGKAYRYGFDVATTLKGDKWGLPGTELNLIFDWRDSTVDDPVLAFGRRLNGDKKIYYEASYRHDIPRTDWAYGFYVEHYVSAERYRLFSVDRNGNDRPFTRVFIEHKNLAGMTLNASISNLIGQEEFFERTRFTARRDVGVIKEMQDSKFAFGPILRFSLSGSF